MQLTYVALTKQSDTVNWCTVKWCTKNLHLDSSSFTSAIQQPNTEPLLDCWYLVPAIKRISVPTITASVSQYSQHYLGLIMRPSFCHPPPHPHKRGHTFLFQNKSSVHHSCSLHPGTTQSAKQRSCWDARLPSINIVIMPVPWKICHPSIVILLDLLLLFNS